MPAALSALTVAIAAIVIIVSAVAAGIGAVADDGCFSSPALPFSDQASAQGLATGRRGRDGREARRRAGFF